MWTKTNRHKACIVLGYHQRFWALEIWGGRTPTGSRGRPGATISVSTVNEAPVRDQLLVVYSPQKKILVVYMGFVSLRHFVEMQVTI